MSQTDYYVIVQVRDVHSGKVLAQEAANFAGAEEGWASGVRMLIDHHVLPVTAALPPAQAACKIADVNPVSGQAECVDPQGAPVAPPPPRDDKSQQHCPLMAVAMMQVRKMRMLVREPLVTVLVRMRLDPIPG